MEPDESELNWQLDMASHWHLLTARADRLRTIDMKRVELSMAERMHDYAEGWKDRLMHEIADLEQEEADVPDPPLPRSPCATCGHPYDTHTATSQRNCQIADCRCQHYDYPPAAGHTGTDAGPLPGSGTAESEVPAPDAVPVLHA